MTAAAAATGPAAAAGELMDMPPDGIAGVQALAAMGRDAEARQMLRRLIVADTSPAVFAAAARLWEGWENAPLPGDREIRAAVLGTGTLDPLGAHLRIACAGAGLHPRIHVGGFGRWAQELLDRDSAVYASRPEIIFLYLDPEALFLRLVSEPFLAQPERDAEAADGLNMLFRALGAAAVHAPQALVVLHTFAVPDHSLLGIRDAMAEDSQSARVASLNRTVAERVRAGFPQVFLLDQERIEARYGKARVRDPRRWYLASIPFSDGFLSLLAAEYLRILRPVKGMVRKCIVLDLDNTLWGGVVGEDGFDGIRLGGTAAPGNAFRDFQLALDALRQRGILLALCSKNNAADVHSVLERHPGMVLRPEHFAALRINWEDKAANIAAIAQELNIGLDSLVFLDDSPAERARVRERLPEVLTPEMPRDPALYRNALLTLDVFESIALTDEDRRRSALYAEQRQRREFIGHLSPGSESAGTSGTSDTADTTAQDDLTAHLADLRIEVRLGPATPFTLPRIAQLINKTNQFNLTTRRYTEAEVRAMAADEDGFCLYAADVSDRFGDSGLTGVAIVRKAPDHWEIDTFLLSCRVMGRGVETALLAFIVRQAGAAGVSVLRGTFVPTAKNAPAADFYAKSGFRPGGDGDGAEEWEASLDTPETERLRAYPDWLTVSIIREGQNVK